MVGKVGIGHQSISAEIAVDPDPYLARNILEFHPREARRRAPAFDSPLPPKKLIAEYYGGQGGNRTHKTLRP